ncbi:hypothetical protein E2C11_14430 [Streptomyces lavendulae]|nr:hypothetical protein E2C11_14430 [Streptomyces lavendulae]
MTGMLSHGYWGECSTKSLRGPREGYGTIATIDAYSASQADSWVAITMRTISQALDVGVANPQTRTLAV